MMNEATGTATPGGPSRPVVAAIGECMVELSPADGGLFRLGFGGDTLNTAVTLARLGQSVGYLTALGDDPFSARMIAAWQAEGIDTAAVARLPGRMPGLYAIELDATGERSFHYWRGEAAARDLASAVDLADALAGVRLAYFSGITVSVVRPEARARFLSLLEAARAGGLRLAFDPNVRLRAWPDLSAARTLFARAFAAADVALATLEDLAALGVADTPAEGEAFLASAAPGEAVLRVSPRECRIRDAAGVSFRSVSLPPVGRVVDTTGAGDSFNGGYLAARLAGRAAAEAVRVAHGVASVVVGHRGAVVPENAADWHRFLHEPENEGEAP